MKLLPPTDESSSRVTVSFVLHSNGTINELSVLSSTPVRWQRVFVRAQLFGVHLFEHGLEMVEVYMVSRELTLRFYYR